MVVDQIQPGPVQRLIGPSPTIRPIHFFYVNFGRLSWAKSNNLGFYFLGPGLSRFISFLFSLIFALGHFIVQLLFGPEPFNSPSVLKISFFLKLSPTRTGPWPF